MRKQQTESKALKCDAHSTIHTMGYYQRSIPDAFTTSISLRSSFPLHLYFTTKSPVTLTVDCTLTMLTGFICISTDCVFD